MIAIKRRTQSVTHVYIFMAQFMMFVFAGNVVFQLDIIKLFETYLPFLFSISRTQIYN